MQKPSYDRRISDWSSDVCSSDLLVVGFPQIWKTLAQSALQGGRPIPPDVRGITSTAPCPPDTARLVRSAGFARLVELYGSSETMGIGWRDDPAQPYTQLGRASCRERVCQYV